MIALNEEILRVTEASEIVGEKTIQSLWSGYGEIKKYFLKGGKYASMVVKHIDLPEQENHPRGWNTERSHERKLKSYQVEKNWYQHFSNHTNAQCRIPQNYHAAEEGSQLLLLMEDLDAAGYHLRLQPETVTLARAKNCLTWLAHFHGKFVGNPGEGLWPIGTYWHLATRPDESEKMENLQLKDAAFGIDKELSETNHQTLVHGDAKLANFCFSETGEVAAVDFQYVGKGCGMKDVAYFISSCFEEKICDAYEEELLEHYFEQLESAIDPTIDFQALRSEWDRMYKYAWADFYRFLDGWSPGHWKMHGYSKRITEAVINELASR